MTLKTKSEVDNQIMRLMKVETLSHVIATTNKGTLTLSLSKGGTENDYRFILDAVPYDDKTNKELLTLFKGVLFD